MKVPPPNLATLLLLLLLVAIYQRPLSDLDFAWQVRTGEQIVRTRSLHVTDELTYTIAGNKIPDFEWLYEVVLAGAWNAFGYRGLHLLKVVCVATPLFLVARRLTREGMRAHGVWVWLAVAILPLIPSWNLRPFCCTTIGLLLLSGWLRDHCVGRRPLSWETPLLMLIWGNAHPGVITGQGLLLGAVAWEWVNRWLRWNPPLDRAASIRLIVVGGMALLASLICPGPLERLRYTFDPNLAHPIMRGFVEMQPLHVFALRPPFFAALIYVVAGLVLLTVVLRFREYRMWELALLGGLALLASYAFRSAQDFLLVSIAVGVPRLARLYRDALYARPYPPGGLLKPVWAAERTARRVLGARAFRFQPGYAVAVVLLMGLTLTPLGTVLRPFPDGVDWPVRAVDAVEREDLRGNFFANPNDGTYLVWRRGPDRARCYVDTRGFYFPPEVLEDALYVTTRGHQWKERLRRVLERGTDWFLLRTGGPAGELWRAMEKHVRAVHVDEQAALVSADEVRKWLDEAP